MKLTVLAALIVLSAAGCARPGRVGSAAPSSPAPSTLTPTSPAAATPTPTGSASPASPASSTVPVLPTLRPPTAPPRTPTDAMPAQWIAGRVTRGGSGPCYGVLTDDGKEYAVYSTAGVTLAVGDTVRVNIEPLAVYIFCGAGDHVHGLKIQVVS